MCSILHFCYTHISWGVFYRLRAETHKKHFFFVKSFSRNFFFREIDFTKKILRNRFDEIFNRYLETYRLPYFQHFAHQSMNVISTSMKLFTGLNEKKIIYNNHKILIQTCNTNILKALVFYSMLTFWIRDCNSVICGLKSFATS